MNAPFKRETSQLLQRLGWQKKPHYRPCPQSEIDYDKLYEEVATRYPKIMKRLAE